MQAHTSHDKAVRPSVCPSHACIVTKRTKVLPTLLYHMKDPSSFLTRRMVGGGRPLLPEILDQTDPPLFQKRRFSIDIRS